MAYGEAALVRRDLFVPIERARRARSGPGGPSYRGPAMRMQTALDRRCAVAPRVAWTRRHGRRLDKYGDASMDRHAAPHDNSGTFAGSLAVPCGSLARSECEREGSPKGSNHALPSHRIPGDKPHVA